MHDHQHNSDMVPSDSSKIEYVKFFTVLLGIITISFLLLIITSASGIMELMRLFMGVFFVVFAGFKFAGYKMFVTMFAGYDLIAKRSQVYAYAYPFIELSLGIAYLLNTLPIWRDFLTLTIMGIGAIGVWHEIKKRSGVHCACLGNVIRLPLSTVSFSEDVTMGLMAAIMIMWRLF